MRRDPLLQQEAIAGDGILQRRGKRMLGRPAIAERERARAGLAPDLGRERPVALDRARNVAAAVQEQDRAGRVGGRRCRPFRRHAVGGHWLEPDVRGRRIISAEPVETIAPLREARRTRPRGEDRYGSRRSQGRTCSSLRGRYDPSLGRAETTRSSSGMTLTWAATTNQPSGKRTQVCICRPTLPDMVVR